MILPQVYLNVLSCRIRELNIFKADQSPKVTELLPSFIAAVDQRFLFWKQEYKINTSVLRKYKYS